MKKCPITTDLVDRAAFHPGGASRQPRGVIPVGIDASAGVELVVDSIRGGSLLTDDGRLANAPTLTVPVLHLP